MEMVLQNVHATAPLRVRVDLVCNTPEEQILANVLENSKDQRRTWINQRAANKRTAVLVGNGPSLKSTLTQVRALCEEPLHDIFALNGACTYLTRRQIEVDYQVIMDAQRDTRHLVGRAGCHLFASQVDPILFKMIPTAVLWHASYGERLVDEQEGFDAAGRSYCLIGSAVSVGATSLPLLYALGYRHFKVFGLDSSNQGDVTHARPQDNNRDDVYTLTEFQGVTYESSLTMRAQAGEFISRARRYEAMDCKFEVFGDGLMPAMWRAKLSEQEKYTEVWKHNEYRGFSPGEHAAKDFLAICQPTPANHVVDLGCGTGRGGDAIQQSAYCKVTLVDFVDAVDKGVELPLVLADIREPSPIRADFVYCTDVLEHIPPEGVSAVIQNALAIAPVVFFQISLIPDSMGVLIGQELHLSVHPYEWWLREFEYLGYTVTSSVDKGDIAQYVVAQ